MYCYYIVFPTGEHSLNKIESHVEHVGISKIHPQYDYHVHIRLRRGSY